MDLSKLFIVQDKKKGFKEEKVILIWKSHFTTRNEENTLLYGTKRVKYTFYRHLSPAQMFLCSSLLKWHIRSSSGAPVSEHYAFHLYLVLLELSKQTHKSPKTQEKNNSYNMTSNHLGRRCTIHSVQKPLEGLEWLQLGGFQVQHEKVLGDSDAQVWRNMPKGADGLPRCSMAPLLSQTHSTSRPRSNGGQHILQVAKFNNKTRLLDSNFQQGNPRDGGNVPEFLLLLNTDREICNPSFQYMFK